MSPENRPFRGTRPSGLTSRALAATLTGSPSPFFQILDSPSAAYLPDLLLSSHMSGNCYYYYYLGAIIAYVRLEDPSLSPATNLPPLPHFLGPLRKQEPKEVLIPCFVISSLRAAPSYSASFSQSLELQQVFRKCLLNNHLHSCYP